MIYLNAAGHGLPDPAVRARIRAYLDQEDEVGPAQAEKDAAEEMAGVVGLAAQTISAGASDVQLIGTTTLAWNAAVLCLPLAGKRVLIAPGEWSSDVAVIQRMGAEVVIIPTTPDGQLDLDFIETEIKRGIGAICVPMICSLTGEQYPVHEIGALPRPETTFYIIDGAQALGQVPVDVSALNCDVFASTLRKWMRGPRDTALLYVAPKVFPHMHPNPAPRLAGIAADGLDIRDHEGMKRFHPGEVYVPQRLGLGTALKLFLDQQETILPELADLAQHTRAKAKAAGFDIAAAESRSSTITTLRVPTDQKDVIAVQLDQAGIACKMPTSDCEPLRDPVSVKGGFLRISPHVYNTKADIDAVFDAIG